MKTLISAFAIAASLSLGAAALAQPSGGPDAKGNAPLKPAHTVDDGSAKRGANSFTEKQATEHIVKSGFTSVSGLAKGQDGVWRGQAMRDGQTVGVALDFKGNVSTGPTPGAATASAAGSTTAMTTSHAASRTTATTSGSANGSTTGAGSTTTSMAAPAHHPHHRHGNRCAHPSPNGAACSGVDRNGNGISDKEDRAIAAGAHP